MIAFCTARAEMPRQAIPAVEECISAEGPNMPRYYFDVTNAGSLTRDDFGAECDDDDDARFQAVALLPDIARESLPTGDQHEFVATVRNQAGEIVYEASFALSGRWWPGRR